MGLVVLALAYMGRDPIWAIVLLSLAVMLQGAGSSGFMSSMIDIAPNYAGIIFGLCGTIGCMPGFVSAYIVGVLTLNNVSLLEILIKLCFILLIVYILANF